MKHKIHYHSHAAFFSGAENMISILLESEELDSKFTKSFSYRYSKSYQNGFKKRVHNFHGKSYAFRFLHIHSYEQLPSFIPNFLKRIILFIMNSLLFYPMLSYQIFILTKLFKKIKPDILHINNAGYPAALSSRAAALAGHISGVPKIIMVVNNMAVGYSRPSRWIEYPIDKLIAKCVDKFITGSKSAACQLKHVLKLPTHKIKTVHNGIKFRERLYTNNETRKRLELTDFKGLTFGVVALLVPRKGHKILLEALSDLVLEKKFLNSEFRLLIEGTGPMYQELIDMVSNRGLAPWVTFLGHEENIIDFISAIDVLVWPSIEDEDFPNIISEAMGLGKPVIASRLAGTPEQLIDNETGILVEPRNKEQLASAIVKLVKNKEIRKSMGCKALEVFKNKFSSEIAIENYINLYEKLLEGKK